MNAIRSLYFSNRDVLLRVRHLPERMLLNKSCSRNKSYLTPDRGVNVDERFEEPGFVDEDEYYTFPTKKRLRDAKKVLREEFEVWKEEWRERFRGDPNVTFNPGEVHKIYKFSNEEEINEWSVISDSSENTGFSKCSFTQSANGHALFSGNLSLKVPDDGKTYRAGFCAANAPRPRKSFMRKTQFDWAMYTHLVFKVRGDGRSFMVNLGVEGEIDLQWYSTYAYTLFTRGGPYWQFSKIPFSKFILGNRGYVQDIQNPVNLESITSFGLAISDDVEGPFQLEIDYIGLVNDFSHVEEHAYETYKMTEYMCENQ